MGFLGVEGYPDAQKQGGAMQPRHSVPRGLRREWAYVLASPAPRDDRC